LGEVHGQALQLNKPKAQKIVYNADLIASDPELNLALRNGSASSEGGDDTANQHGASNT